MLLITRLYPIDLGANEVENQNAERMGGKKTHNAPSEQVLLDNVMDAWSWKWDGTVGDINVSRRRVGELLINSNEMTQ